MKIAIIGLGWLGLPLARSLYQQSNFVIGSTTSPKKLAVLKNEEFDTVQFKLDPHPVGTSFQKLFEMDIAIITIPPGSAYQSGEFYLEQLKFLKYLLENSSIQKVIFMSSTSIYPKESRKISYDENENLDDSTVGNQILLKAESIFQKNNSFDSTVIRFGGLMGEDRIPLNYFSGKENVDGESRVNYIHLSDAIGIVEWTLSANLWNRTFNAVAPIHPKKRDIFNSNAEKLGLTLPKSYKSEEGKENRLIGSSAISKTGFYFKFPDPLEFTYRITD